AVHEALRHAADRGIGDDELMADVRSNSATICLNTDCMAAADRSRISAAPAAPAPSSAIAKTAEAGRRATAVVLPDSIFMFAHLSVRLKRIGWRAAWGECRVEARLLTSQRHVPSSRLRARPPAVRAAPCDAVLGRARSGRAGVRRRRQRAPASLCPRHAARAFSSLRRGRGAPARARSATIARLSVGWGIGARREQRCYRPAK